MGLLLPSTAEGSPRFEGITHSRRGNAHKQHSDKGPASRILRSTCKSASTLITGFELSTSVGLSWFLGLRCELGASSLARRSSSLVCEGVAHQSWQARQHLPINERHLKLSTTVDVFENRQRHCPARLFHLDASKLNAYFATMTYTAV